MDQYPELTTTYFLECPCSNKDYKTCKETGKYEPYTGKKKFQGPETPHQSKQMSDLTGKDFKVTIINVFKE